VRKETNAAIRISGLPLPWVRAAATMIALCGLLLAGQTALGDDAQSLLEKGRQLHEKQQYEEALAVLKQAFRDAPTDLDINYQLGLTAVAAGELEYAAMTFGRMLMVDSDLPRVKLELARVYYALRTYSVSEQLFRDVLRIVAPGVALITETNVPHKENVSYFGKGHDEAHMVYNFALPPLVLHTFYTEDATALSRWADGLGFISDTTTFFNFLDSHDGIGVMAVRGILTEEEIAFIIQRAEEHGGYVSYQTGQNGTEVPYEINITWFSALNRDDGHEDIAFQVKRFVASRIIALVLRGVPGIYLHSLIGARNDIEAVLATKSNRDINRTVIDARAVIETLKDPFSKFSRISREFGRLIVIRTKHRAFHPSGAQRVLFILPSVFSVIRSSPEGDRFILALTNVTSGVTHLEICLSEIGTNETRWYDLVSGMEWMAENERLFITLQPYDVIWLEPFGKKVKKIKS